MCIVLRRIALRSTQTVKRVMGKCQIGRGHWVTNTSATTDNNLLTDTSATTGNDMFSDLCYNWQ